MGTIKEYLNKAKTAKSGLLDESEKIIYKHEPEIIRLQTAQMESGIGENDKTLINNSPIFSGRYTLYTQLLDSRKTAGELYDFNNTGTFLSNLTIDFSNDKTSFYIYSTGTGSSDKKKFFDGYNNLFGLTKQNSYKINWDILYPEILNFLNQTL